MNGKSNSILTLFLLLIVLIGSGEMHAQERNWSIDGYVKELFMYYRPRQVSPFAKIPDLYTNTIHNRLNYSWYANEQWTVKAGMRNRFITGNMPGRYSSYSKLIDIDNGIVDLSWMPADGDSWLFHTMLDRAYVDYSRGKWQVRVGRQRINWGISNVWTPNDVFNSFSYFDFDYEERPGSDAVKIQYYTGVTSSMEVVYKLAQYKERMALAGMYRFSKANFDYQVIAGWVGKDYVLGGGWTGDIKGGGFRGEFTYFKPQSAHPESKETLVAALSYDYTFTNHLYCSIEGLYNSSGVKGKAASPGLFTNQALSAKNLTQARFALFGTSSYAVSPLLNISLSGMFNPCDYSYFVNPACTYSLSDNLELMLTAQLFWGDKGTEFGDIGRLYFGRLRWSF